MKARYPLIFGAALFGAFCVGATFALAAIPGHANPADIKIIDECLADSSKAKADPDICIGRVWNACLGAEQTAPGKEDCGNRELDVWIAALNRDVALLAIFLTDESAKIALREAQREYAVLKLKKCSFERIAHKDDPISLAAAARCDVRETARQDLWLLDQINSFKKP
jgi:uncharacterized protein YecT (DUF1311 family)